MDFRDERGRLRSGHPGLKSKGSSSRLPLEIKNKITDFLNGEIDSIEEIYCQVSARDKLKFLTELLSYVLPKSKEILVSETQDDRLDLSKLSDEDLDTLEKLQLKMNS